VFVVIIMSITHQFLRIGKTMHYPVMHREVSQLVSEYAHLVEDTKPQLQMFDGTFGGGGHSVTLLDSHKNLKILGTDLDYGVLEQCRHEYADLI
jgi:16S rRNA (cytosine1402-N4)-methyltransferase